MSVERDEVWQALLRSGEQVATDTDYEHGYKREVRSDLTRYVTFRIHDEVYGLPITSVVEIAKPFVTTPVPRTREWVLGIGNVRGTVIPVLELSHRLRMPTAASTRATRVLVVEVDGEMYGLRVDEVLEVVAFAPEELEDAPGGIGSTRADFIAALGRRKKKIVIVLSLEDVVDPKEMVDPRFRTAQDTTGGAGYTAVLGGTIKPAGGRR